MMRPPAQHVLIVEREPVLVAPGARCGHTIISRLPIVDLIYPHRFAGWSCLRKSGRSKALLDLLLCRAILSMGEEPSFVGFEKGTPAECQHKKDE